MIERRQNPRIRVDSVAFIQTRTGHPVACRIRDRSAGGARLAVDSVLGIPDAFRLVVQKTGEAFPVTVVWRGPQEIGVAFQEVQGIPAVGPHATIQQSMTDPADPSLGHLVPGG